MLVAIEAPGPPASGTATVTTTATSNFVPGCGGTVTPQAATVDTELQLDPLGLVKRAFQLDGTPIANGSTLPTGMPVRFLIYVSNPGGLISDVSLRDVLDPLFAYVPGSMRYDASVTACAANPCTAVEEAAIFAAADGGTVGTDALDGDVVSIAGATIDAGDQNVANTQLDLPADKVWALVFTILMQ
jgi:hypothetical protein